MLLNKENRNLALIGAGYWGKNLARNFHQLGVLHSICDASNKTLEILAEQYKDLNSTVNPDEILSNEKITRVAIAAPAYMHYELTKKALLAGKDVFVEKPLCLDLKEAAELVNLSKERNRILMVGHLLQYHPCVEHIKALLASGEFGKLHYISSSRLNLGKFRKEENALWSFAPHDLSVILSLVGDILPENIQCVGGAYLNPRVVDTTMTTMRFNGDVRAHVHVSWLNPFKEQNLIIVCSDGFMVFDDTKAWNEKLVIYRQHLVWSNGQTPVPNKTLGEPVSVTEAEPLKRECAHFIECCESRIEPRTNGYEGLRVLSTLTFAQESLEADGVPVMIKEADAEKNIKKS